MFGSDTLESDRVEIVWRVLQTWYFDWHMLLRYWARVTTSINCLGRRGGVTSNFCHPCFDLNLVKIWRVLLSYMRTCFNQSFFISKVQVNTTLFVWQSDWIFRGLKKAHFVEHLTWDSRNPDSNVGLIHHYFLHPVTFGPQTNPLNWRLTCTRGKNLGCGSSATKNTLGRRTL